MREKALGPDHPDVATSLNDLGNLYGAEGRLAEAEPFHRKAISIWEKSGGENNPDLAAGLENLADLERRERALEDARRRNIQPESFH